MKSKRNAFWADPRISSVFRLYCLRLVQFNGKTISVAVYTHIKISQVVTGLLPEQCFNTSAYFTLQRQKKATHRRFLQGIGHASIFKHKTKH